MAFIRAAAAVAALVLQVGALSDTRVQLAKLLQKGLEPRVAAHKAKIASGNFKEATVSTPYGTVIGVGGSTVNQYLGIPYAAPPIVRLTQMCTLPRL
jgi:muramidase (phage lysozyme)